MLKQQDLDHFPVRAASAAHFGEDVGLFQKLVVVLPEVMKKFRGFFERYGVDVALVLLQALRQF